MTVSAKPYCDMTVQELEAELRQLHAVLRRAPAWSAHQAAIQSFRDDCKRWLDRRRAEERKVANG